MPTITIVAHPSIREWRRDPARPAAGPAGASSPLGVALDIIASSCPLEAG
jgi:hypothetical protein